MASEATSAIGYRKDDTPSYLVLPLNTRERQSADFWCTPMNVECDLCGENPSDYDSSSYNPHPFPIIHDLNRKKCNIEVSQVVCRTCMLNYPFFGFRVTIPNQIAAWNTEWLHRCCDENRLQSELRKVLSRDMHQQHVFNTDRQFSTTTVDKATGHTIAMSRTNLLAATTGDEPFCLGSSVPPLWALIKFGGTLSWLKYNNPKTRWNHPTCKNPWEYYEYKRNQPIFCPKTSVRTEWLKRACCGCKQRFTSADLDVGVLPAVHATNPAHPMQPMTLTWFFHGNGRCAVSYLIRYSGENRDKRILASSDLWIREYGMSEAAARFAQLNPAPDSRALISRGGILTPSEFQTTTHVQCITESWQKTYPIHVAKSRHGGYEQLLFQDRSNRELQAFDAWGSYEEARLHPCPNWTDWTMHLTLATAMVDALPPPVLITQEEHEIDNHEMEEGEEEVDDESGQGGATSENEQSSHANDDDILS